MPSLEAFRYHFDIARRNIMLKSKPAFVPTIADLNHAIESEQRLCDRLIDASNIQLQAVLRDPDNETETAALERIEYEMERSIEVLGALTVALLNLQVGRLVGYAGLERGIAVW
jgi:hypothetical protein